jgi:hypothetical protein
VTNDFISIPDGDVRFERIVAIPALPFELHLDVSDHPIAIDMSRICGVPTYFTAAAPTSIRFLHSGVHFQREDEDVPTVLDARPEPGGSLTVGKPNNIGPVLLESCRHGFAPPNRCPLWPHN